MNITGAADLGNLIRSTRNEAKITRAELAAASGIGERFVREIEKGKQAANSRKHCT